MGRANSPLPKPASVSEVKLFISEDFNKKILNPDLSSSDLDCLHNDLKAIYKNYCASGGSDKINFEESIIREIKESKFNIYLLYLCIYCFKDVYLNAVYNCVFMGKSIFCQ